MNFLIENKGAITVAFKQLGINDFESACAYLAALPYKRNADPSDPLCVLKEKVGTCSTKHALLRRLALAQGRDDVKLMLGIFKMDAAYSSKIKETLARHHLSYVPEAHNYLKFGSRYYDFTKLGCHYADFESKLMLEKEIEFNELGDKKVQFHKAFIEDWVKTQSHLGAEEVWQIREQCIADLQAQ